jgi:hypothetical protein
MQGAPSIFCFALLDRLMGDLFPVFRLFFSFSFSFAIPLLLVVREEEGRGT